MKVKVVRLSNTGTVALEGKYIIVASSTGESRTKRVIFKYRFPEWCWTGDCIQEIEG